MDINNAALLVALFVFGIIHIFLSILLTREVFNWSLLTIFFRLALILFVWSVPVVGSIVAYKLVKLNWFTKSKGENTLISGAFLEMDSFVNPGARYIVEIKQEKITTHKKETKEAQEKKKISKKGLPVGR